MTKPIPVGRHKPLVYFIRNGNRVKIGYTTHLTARIAALSLSKTFVVLLLDGGRTLEREMHRRFAADRLGATEWFVYSNRLKAYIDSQVTAQEPALYEGLLSEAERIVLDTQIASASMLQRRMRIGFGRARQLMSELERRGVVGPLEGPGCSRDVLVRQPVKLPA